MVNLKRDIFYGFLILLFVSVFIKPSITGRIISPMQIVNLSIYDFITTVIAFGTILSGFVAFKPAGKPYYVKSLENYIQKCLDYGKSQTEIKEILSSVGWDNHHIDKHLGSAVQRNELKQLSNFHSYLKK